jgi:hypothetical protein
MCGCSLATTRERMCQQAECCTHSASRMHSIDTWSALKVFEAIPSWHCQYCYCLRQRVLVAYHHRLVQPTASQTRSEEPCALLLGELLASCSAVRPTVTPTVASASQLAHASRAQCTVPNVSALTTKLQHSVSSALSAHAVCCVLVRHH